MRFADFITDENYWQIASLVIQKSLFMVTHALFYLSCISISISNISIKTDGFDTGQEVSSPLVLCLYFQQKDTILPV